MRYFSIIYIIGIICFYNVNAQSDTVEAKLQGVDDFQKAMMHSLNYPDYAMEYGIEGEVILSFRVNTAGCIDSVIVLESPDESLAEETTRALMRYKCDWTPAKKDNQNVICWLQFPMTFILQNGGDIPGLYRSLENASKNKADITRLNVSDSDLSSFPVEINNFSNITSIRLENNEIRIIPSGLGGLKKLRTLYLSGNNIVKIESGIEQLKKLTTVDLSNNNLQSIPEGVQYLKNVYRIDFSNNQLSDLPEEFQTLKKLRYLNLSDNQFSILPGSILSMTKLYSLDLTGNNFSNKELARIKTKLVNTKILY